VSKNEVWYGYVDCVEIKAGGEFHSEVWILKALSALGVKFKLNEWQISEKGDPSLVQKN